MRPEEELRLAKEIVDHSPVVLFRRLPAPEYTLVYVSENVRRFGYKASDFLEGKITWNDLVHPDDLERLGREVEEHAAAERTSYCQEYRVRTSNGEVRHVEDTTRALRDESGQVTHYEGVVVDVTERKLAEDALRRSEEKFRRIVETAAEGFLLMDPHLRILDANQAYCRMLGFSREEILGLTPMELATDEYRRFLKYNREWLLSNDQRVLEGSLRAKDGRKVPILVKSNTLTGDNGELWGHVAFVSDLTEQKHSLALAAEVQRSLLPTEMPQLDGLQVAARALPCQELGGDYYDILAASGPDNAPLTVFLGDISGHGVDSALLMATARSSLRSHLMRSKSLGDALRRVNRDLFTDFEATSSFMTMIGLSVTPQGEMRWARAGHDPPIIYDPAMDAFASILGHGLPLGVDQTSRYPDNELTPLPQGCIIAMGTDGIWEAASREGDYFGKERFQEIVRAHAHQTAQEILDAVFSQVASFTAGRPQDDDITLAVVKIG
ncbi:PP2C family protein-serine/threonine phosphatase [Desulfohalovibrio reitneri]|uniref:PP2C family protein-serine/threonine phosphatase n=1 Tax=Desulfohalovibrio reitneri TaxID=1307759 RepID=UPI00068F32D7|nr:SpoIIE family protein phosphatase [Desulfohalovibrio reitneri]